MRGYERLVGPMEELSSLFYEKVLKPDVPTGEHRYARLYSIYWFPKPAAIATGVRAFSSIMVARFAVAVARS